jgi:hypothetical protein
MENCKSNISGKKYLSQISFWLFHFFIYAKLSFTTKQHLLTLWTNTIRYLAITCENTTQTWRNLLSLVPNLVVNFGYNNTGMQDDLVASVNPRSLNVVSTYTHVC